MSTVPVPFLLLDFGPEQQNPTKSVIFDLWVNFAESIKYIKMDCSVLSSG